MKEDTHKKTQSSPVLKGHCVAVEKKIFQLNLNLIFNIFSILNKLFSELSEVPRTMFVARKVAGSATCKQSKTIWSCVVLYGHFVYPVMKAEGVCLCCLFRHKEISQWRSFSSDVFPKVTFEWFFKIYIIYAWKTRSGSLLLENVVRLRPSLISDILLMCKKWAVWISASYKI